MKTRFIPAVVVMVACMLLSACASTNYPGPYSAQPYPSVRTPYPSYPATNPAPYHVAYGFVESIQLTQGSATQGSGAGAVIGGVVGGLLGHQVGKGSGRTAATVAGAIGGAIAGNEIEKRNNSFQHNQYLIGVRMDNGGYQTLAQDNVSDLQVGSRVRVENNFVYRY
jgi:outer membrane lipoprotein SlyB